jgi:hypothetical protein
MTMHYTPELRERVARDALCTFGAINQIYKFIEESLELQIELYLYLKNPGKFKPKDLIREIADCRITLDQMALLFGKENCEDALDEKLHRLEGIIKHSPDTNDLISIKNRISNLSNDLADLIGN